MELTNNIYLNCGVYTDTKYSNGLLFIAIPGYFASSAWCKSDNEYNEVLGTKFEGITSDDGMAWMLNRSDIRRIINEDELNKLFEQSCEEFKEIFKHKFNNE